MNKTYFIDDIFSRFFYENIFSEFLKKKIKADNCIALKENVILSKINDEKLKISDYTKLILDLKAKMCEYNGKIIKDKTYIATLNERIQFEPLEDYIKTGMIAKKAKVEQEIERITMEKANLYQNCQKYQSSIDESIQLIQNFDCDLEILTEERSLKKLFPVEALKEARKKTKFLRDSTQLYKITTSKKIFDKKQNCNFSRVWFVKFNKFVLITMFSYFYLKIKI